MLSNKFPARLKKVLLLEPPSFFNLAFRIIRPLIPSKYMEKLAPAKLPELQAYVDADKLLPDFGGTLPFDQNAFVDSLYNEEMQQNMQIQQNQMQQKQQQQMQQVQPTTTPQSKLEEARPAKQGPASSVASVLDEGVASR